MNDPARHRFDYADDLLLEESSNVRHEFLDGAVWAMGGGTPEHARVAANIARILGTQLAGKRCAVYSSELRVRVSATGLTTYPDVTVVCGSLELDPDDPRRHTVVNPSLVVEVLSPSTESYDRGEKLEHDQSIPSLRAIVRVGTEARRIDLWRRSGGAWSGQVVERGTAPVESLGVELPLEDVYHDPLQ